MEAACATKLDQRPNVVVWEVSRACDLACPHCRNSVQQKRSSLELTTWEGYDLIEQVADLRPELFSLSGGDPLKRADIFELIDAASRKGLCPTLATAATPLLSSRAIARMSDAGLGTLALALDGASADSHDGVRGIRGAFVLTIDSIRQARAIGLPVEIDTVVSRFNVSQLGPMIDLLSGLDVVAWNVHFYVPCGPGSSADMVAAQEAEDAFATLYEGSNRVSFEIRTTEAMHYRRYVLQRELRENPDLARHVFERGLSYAALAASMQEDSSSAHPLATVNDARGFVFVSHIGEVYPSGFLPLSGGNVRFRRLANIYRSSPLFTIIRDGRELGGKCGVCEFKEICGGSRARAYAVGGDPMAAEPLCAYQPAVLREEAFAGH